MGGEPMSTPTPAAPAPAKKAARAKKPRMKRVPDAQASVLFDVPGPIARRRYAIGGVLGVVVIAAFLGFAGWMLWESEQISAEEWEPFLDPDILTGIAIGIGQTVLAALASIVLALVFGLVFAAGRLSDHFFFRWPSVAIVEFFRAVPVVLLILAIFLGFGATLERFWSLVIALTLYNGSVLAEVFRAGINAVPRGQSEAGYAIGLRKTGVMTLILAPQAIRVMLPAIISQCVVALKDTALGFIVAAPQLATVIKDIYSGYQNPIAAGLVAAVIYIVINYTLSRIAQWLEARNRRKGRQVVRLTNIPAAAGGMGPGAPAP
jgi:glutamate transport system permease protein